MKPAPTDAAATITVADVSVAMCTRNGARFVAQQVRSILMQSIMPRELVIGDDASSDDTIAVVEEAVTTLRRERVGLSTEVRIHRRAKPLGVAQNFEQTIAECSSSLIALSDQDDIWPAGRLERLLPLFANPAVSLVHTDARLVDAAGVSLGSTLLEALEASARERTALVAGDAFDVLLRRNLATGATMVIRRTIADEARPFPPAWLHDEWLAAVAASTGALRLVDEPWLEYRQHGANEVGASAPDWSRRWSKLSEPRAPRAARLVARSAALVAYLERRGGSTTLLDAARAKLAHEQWRAGLPRWQVLRIPHIAGAILAGRYVRFNRGAIDALRDLVQPS